MQVLLIEIVKFSLINKRDKIFYLYFSNKMCSLLWWWVIAFLITTRTCYIVFTPVFYTHQGTRTSNDPSLWLRCDTVVLMRPVSEKVGNLNWICNTWYSPLVVPLFQRTVSHDYCYRWIGKERDTIRYFTTDCSIAAKWFITFTCGNCSSPTITVLKLKYSIIGRIHYPHEWIGELHIH